MRLCARERERGGKGKENEKKERKCHFSAGRRRPTVAPEEKIIAHGRIAPESNGRGSRSDCDGSCIFIQRQLSHKGGIKKGK